MNGPSLRDVQQELKARVQGRGEPPGGASLAQWLNAQRGTPGAARLAVYAEGYVVRIREALAEVYEAVRHLVGERAFSALAQAYAQRHPSCDYNLSLAGRHLPEFLPAAALTQRLPFLPDLARLEWAVGRAFHAFQCPPLDSARLATRSAGDWGRVQLIFQPSVSLVTSAWPILDLWEARTRPRAEIDIPLVNRPQRVLVFRRELAVQCELVDAPQAAMLEGLLSGRSLGEVCEACSAEVEDPSLLTAWFARWAGWGLVLRDEGAAHA